MKCSWILLSCIVILAACGQNKDSIRETMETEMITRSGVAQNGKGSAVLIAVDGTVYYIEGTDSWETDVVGRRIKITGVLQRETMSEGDLKNEKGEYSQGVVGEKRILNNVKWEVLEK